MKPIAPLIMIALLVWPALLGAGVTAVNKAIGTAPGQPIQIVSDRLEAYSEKKMVVFSGNAVATQGDKSIHSERIILYYRKGAPDNPDQAGKLGQTAGDLERVEAKGGVRVVQGDRIVTGEEAVFYEDQQKVVMTGNAVMLDGANVVRGQKIIVFLNEKRGVVEADANKRVTATIYPNDRKDAPGKKDRRK